MTEPATTPAPTKYCPTQDTTLIRALAMTTPAIRMVCVHANVHKDEGGQWTAPGVEFLPVLALVGKSIDQYLRYVEDRRKIHGIAPTHEGMQRLGWHFQSVADYVSYDALVHIEEYGGVVEAGFAFDGCLNCGHEVVPAPWPPEEDAERLTDVVERVIQKARKKYEAAAARRRGSPC